MSGFALTRRKSALNRGLRPSEELTIQTPLIRFIVSLSHDSENPVTAPAQRVSAGNIPQFLL